LLTIGKSFLSGTDTASEMELMPKPEHSIRINHTNSCNGTRDPEETSDTTETDVLTLEVVNNHQILSLSGTTAIMELIKLGG